MSDAKDGGESEPLRRGSSPGPSRLQESLSKAQGIHRPLGHDPAEAAHAEQEAFEALWRVVYSTTINWDTKLRHINTLLTALGLLNLAVVFALFQGCWSSDTLAFSLEQHCASYLPLQFVSYVTYGAFVAVLIWYYIEKAEYKALISHFPSRWSAFTHSGLFVGFWSELGLSLVQPFPILYLLVDLSHAQYLVILSLIAKLYLFLRLLRDWSEVYRKRMFIKQNTRFNTSYYAMDYLTIAKTYCYHYTFWVLLIGLSLSCMFMAYLMHICEREYWIPQHKNSGLTPRTFDSMHGAVVSGGTNGASNGGNSDVLLFWEGNTYFQSPYVSFINCAYFIGIVATTTGLGDIAPITQQGKVFAVAAAFMGIAWSSFAVGIYTNKLVPSDFQAYCIDYLNRADIDRDKHRLAAILIQKTWRMHREYQKMESQGIKINQEKRKVTFTEKMTPWIRKFQSVQREEMNQQYLFQDPSASVAAANARVFYGDVESAASTRRKEVPALPSSSPSASVAAAAASNASAVRAAQAQSPAQPLSSDPQVSYGSSASSLASGSSSGSGGMRLGVPPSRLIRSASVSARSSEKREISAKHALKALHYLHSAKDKGFGVQPSPVGSTILSSAPAPQRSQRKLGMPTGMGAAASGDLLSNQLQLSNALVKLEHKLDQLLIRGIAHENMVEQGHVFLSWRLNGKSGREEDAISQPVLIWLEMDGTKYGSLHWTSEEFAVYNRLRIKVEGQNFPLHSITDVFLGKTSPEFQMTASKRVAASLCFSIMSKAHPTVLRLSAKYADERSHWMSQFKQAFTAQQQQQQRSRSRGQSVDAGQASAIERERLDRDSPSDGSQTPTSISQTHTGNPLGRFHGDDEEEGGAGASPRKPTGAGTGQQ